ncbi:MAG TPA: phosphoglucosamine mutase, partial [Candidatus Koribacter sp.]
MTTLSPETTQPRVRQLFGTDGIRGVAGEYPLDAHTVFAIGRALGSRLAAQHASPRVLIGQDTRESSDWISRSLARGLQSSQADVVSAGVITTPGVAYLTRTHGFSAGIVISASHNPWNDNGIKVFGANGYKLSDHIEHQIESQIFFHLEELERADSEGQGPVMLPGDAKLREDYAAWLRSQVAAIDFSRFRVLLDCANGAACSIANLVFPALNIVTEFTHVCPTGRNINANCGALHPQEVAQRVAQAGGRFDLGITFDGDADRALFSDAGGNIVNGDAVLLLAARDMKSRNRLASDTVVATTMSNMGLEAALKHSGIRMLRAAVGDKYVLEEMQMTGATLGGEQSGHILFMDSDATTGDGILTALRVLEVLARSGKSLADLLGDLKVFPQVIRNIKVREKTPLSEIPSVAAAIHEAEHDLGDTGRVVVRYSGTEKLAR